MKKNNVFQDWIIISSIKVKENETFVSMNILKFTKNNIGKKKVQFHIIEWQLWTSQPLAMTNEYDRSEPCNK